MGVPSESVDTFERYLVQLRGTKLTFPANRSSCSSYPELDFRLSKNKWFKEDARGKPTRFCLAHLKGDAEASSLDRQGRLLDLQLHSLENGIESIKIDQSKKIKFYGYGRKMRNYFKVMLNGKEWYGQVICHERDFSDEAERIKAFKGMLDRLGFWSNE